MRTERAASATETACDRAEWACDIADIRTLTSADRAESRVESALTLSEIVATFAERAEWTWLMAEMSVLT